MKAIKLYKTKVAAAATKAGAVLVCLCTCLLLPATADAQVSFYQRDTTAKVFAYNHELTMAGGGGFNAPQFSMADLNHDGLQDLVVFERGLGVTTYLNKGTAGNPDYRYAPEFIANFPPIYTFLTMVDYNCDGITDLFEGYAGYTAYKGYYNADNQLCFTLYKELFYENEPAHPHSSAFSNPGDIPAIADVDNDGDLDFIAYEINGVSMYWYKNQRVELGLPCDSIHIDLKDRCWGKVSQGYNRAHALGETCSNAGLLRPAGEKRTHQGNAICVFDWDMDGDMDYFDGSVSFNELIFLKNGRIDYGSAVDSMVSQDTLWQTGGKRVNMPTWPAAFNVDVDQDGKKDLLISPNAASGAENYNCIWYYKNFSTAGTPDWRFQSDSFLTDKTVDMGTASSPMLFDYDKDGKPDLILGSDGYRQSSGQLKSRLSWYKNTSTPGHPTFVLQTNDLLGISASNFQGAAPAAGDIDGDGKADLVLGHTNGTLSYYKNMAASNAVQPDWQLTQLSLADMNGTPITVDNNAAPFIYDMNNDGKKDLVIGSVYGYLQYYQNISTVPGTIKLKFINTKLGMAQSDPAVNFGGLSTPFIGQVDSTGTDYLLMGSNSGKIYRYTGFQGGDVTTAYTMLDSQYSYIDTLFNAYNRQSTYSALYNGNRTAITVGDVDGSGSYSMIVGNVRGGLEFYKRKVYVVGTPLLHESGRVMVYPNPASDVLNLSWSNMLQEELQVRIIDMSGRQLLSASLPADPAHAALSLANVPPGVYTCQLQSGANRYYTKFTVIR